MTTPMDVPPAEDGHKTPNEQTRAAMRQARWLMARRVSERTETPKESGMAVESLPGFSPAARQRWESIPADVRQRLLANVWCAHCHHEAA